MARPRLQSNFINGLIEEHPMSRYEDFQRDGYFIHARPVIPEDLVRRAMEGVDDVLAGRYETGIPPQPSYWNPGDDPNKLGKVEMPQLANRAIKELVSHPALGRLAAEVTGAKRVQVWWVQLLSKPPASTDAGSGVSVGWHQDRQYWKAWKEGSELFTAWVAVSDVGPDTGPMAFVKGSHKWGLLNQGAFYIDNSDDIEMQRDQISLPPGETWREVEATMSPAAFHSTIASPSTAAAPTAQACRDGVSPSTCERRIHTPSPNRKAPSPSSSTTRKPVPWFTDTNNPIRVPQSDRVGRRFASRRDSHKRKRNGSKSCRCVFFCFVQREPTRRSRPRCSLSAMTT